MELHVSKCWLLLTNILCIERKITLAVKKRCILHYLLNYLLLFVVWIASRAICIMPNGMQSIRWKEIAMCTQNLNISSKSANKYKWIKLYCWVAAAVPRLTFLSFSKKLYVLKNWNCASSANQQTCLINILYLSISSLSLYIYIARLRFRLTHFLWILFYIFFSSLKQIPSVWRFKCCWSPY
jgi:hypothetical protein